MARKSLQENTSNPLRLQLLLHHIQMETLAKSCVEKPKSTAHVPVAMASGSVTVARTLEET